MDEFFRKPILNSPYEYPGRHWEMDETGQPTNRIFDECRRVALITPIPAPRKRRGQRQFVFDKQAQELETDRQQYDPTPIINDLRRIVDAWRGLPASKWRVTPETARLLHHWRHHSTDGIRPFFCQVEAVETAIWLTEVAPRSATGRRFLDRLRSANEQANPGLERLALKLATGAGKTTVMAMLIAWQRVNAARHPTSPRFTRGFLVVTPGLTIRDRLRVLQPNDPDSYYRSRELVPGDLLGVLDRAKIVVTYFHAFMLRETLELSKGGRALLQGRGPELRTSETEGQMLQRVVPELMSMKNVMVLNDEAHHCYRELPKEESEETDLKGDDRKEAEKNSEAARVWISGLEAVQRRLGLSRIIDLSATPFFLRGSGCAEGTLFPWTMSDFSLMDAIECGIVKLPRVPVADNIPGADMPRLHNLWEHIGKEMPKKGRGKAAGLDPLSIPVELQTALDALYGHYAKTFDEWPKAGTFVLTPEIVGPSTHNAGIIGEGVDLDLIDRNGVRTSELVYHLTRELLEQWREPNQEPKLHLFGQLKRIARRWIDDHLVCNGGTNPAQLMYQELANRACERITRAIVSRHLGEREVKAVLDPYNSVASTIHVNFATSKQTRWERIRAVATSTGWCVTVTGKRNSAASWSHISGSAPTPRTTVWGWKYRTAPAPRRTYLPQVKVNGVDVFHPNTGEIRSDGPGGIACWFIDTDYNQESFFVRHAYFLGASDPYKALKTTLKAEIRRDAWETLHSDISRPFDRPDSGRIAVKVINHLGDEVMKVFRV